MSRKTRPMCDEGAKLLCDAIVAQAVIDWVYAVKILKKDATLSFALDRKKECECFFASPWFEQISGRNGERCLAAMNKKFGVCSGKERK